MSLRGPGRFRWHRPVDLVVAVTGGLVSLPVVVAAGIGAAVSTRSFGVFRQRRIGRHGEPFIIVKLQTMRASTNGSTVTTAGDQRITKFGRVIRRLKLDELPQLLNVALGEMALVGPRPDVPGFADLLEGNDRCVIDVRPGITGPATLLMRNEEQILMGASDAELTNRELLYPLTPAVNRAWIEQGTLVDDFRLLVWTVIAPTTASLYRLFDRWDPQLRLNPNFRCLEEMNA